nr:MAG TPA: hypothetical protein [Caudoviricetes sp.]
MRCKAQIGAANVYLCNHNVRVRRFSGLVLL